MSTISTSIAMKLASEPVIWTTPTRARAFEQWLAPLVPKFSLLRASLAPASADASFRRYLRLETTDRSCPSVIVMDAPPEHEDCRPFVHVDELMRAAGLRVPHILAWDEPHGFMLLSDLGQRTLLDALTDASPAKAQTALVEATKLLVQWQLASRPGELPVFDEALLRRDLGLFPEWYAGRYRQHTLTAEEKATWNKTADLIVARALAAPSVYVHRDFMPRNLMPGQPLADGGDSELGILDFQDAVLGPITYDIASLMRDAFHSWDEELVLDVTIRYWQSARAAGLPVPEDFSDFWIDVEWMGLQRHLKVLGIFARITLRDGKPKYLADTPRFIRYVRATCSRYRELAPLLRLIDRIEGIEPQVGYTF